MALSTGFERKKLLYVGHQAHVFHGHLNDEAKTPVAIKEISLPVEADDGSAKIREKLEKYIQRGLQLQHSNIVKIYGYQILPETFLKPPTFNVFMAYCEGETLAKRIYKSDVPIFPADAQKWTKNILCGLNYLHNHEGKLPGPIVHRNLKSTVIFFNSNGQLLIGGLAAGRELRENSTFVKEVSQTKKQLEANMSPEWIQNYESVNANTNIGRRSDIWSVGCIVIEMLTRDHPRFLKDGNKLIGLDALNFVAKEQGKPVYPEKAGPDVIKFLDRCFIHNQLERPHSNVLLHDPFITNQIS